MLYYPVNKKRILYELKSGGSEKQIRLLLLLPLRMEA